MWPFDPKHMDKGSLYAAIANNPVLNSDFLGDSIPIPKHIADQLLVMPS